MNTVFIERPWGRVEVPCDPIFGNPRYEKEHFDRLKVMAWEPDPVFVDVGAHVGIWTTFLSSLAGLGGHVHAFEPHPDNREVLARNCGPLDNVEIHPEALGEINEERTLHIHPTGDHQLIGGGGGIQVQVRTLDSFDLKRVDFIKIDVEHWEDKVLYGAAATVRRCRPRILVEIHNGEVQGRVQGFFTALGHAPEDWRTEGRSQPYLYVNGGTP